MHTITFDNGGEFAEHKAIEEALGAETYFAHPYSSWERGLNENSNGLLRQFIPKGTDLREVTDEDVRRAGAVAQPTTSEMSRIQAAYFVVLEKPRLPSGLVNELIYRRG